MKGEKVKKKLEDNESDFLRRLSNLAGGNMKGNDRGFIGKMINKEKLNSPEKYASRVFFSYNRIIKTIEDVNRVKLFFRRFPFREFYKQNDLYESDYYQYHLEVYSHKIATFEDTLLILSNEILMLGFLKKQCTWRHNNYCKSLKKTCLGAYVIQRHIKDSLKENKHLRDLNSHRAYFQEDIFDEEGVIMKMYDQMNPAEAIKMPLGYLPYHSAIHRIKQRRKEYVSSFEKRKKWMEKMLRYYLYEITPHFEENLIKLNSDPSPH